MKQRDPAPIVNGQPFIGPFVLALVLVFGAFFFVMIFQST